MTPQTDREWAKVLAPFHPEGQTPDLDTFLELQRQREAWRASHIVCARLGCSRLVPVNKGRLQDYCGRQCANLARARNRYGRIKLKSGRVA